jgi:hypothetical protein
MSNPETPDSAEQAAGSTVADLRRHLFETMAALRDKANPMPVDRARAVSEVARTIIESARVEVDAARLQKRIPSSGFLAVNALPAPAPGTPPVPNGIKSVTRHLLGDEEDEKP